MDSPSKRERCQFMSIIRSSTFRRRNNPRTMPAIHSSSDPTHFGKGHDDLANLGSSSLSRSTSSSRISQQLDKLDRLLIPKTPPLPSIQRHPTVLRAGPPPRPHIYHKSPEVANTLELFTTATSSTVPAPASLPPLPSPQVAINPTKHYLGALTFNPSAASTIKPHLRNTTIKQPAEPPFSNTDLEPIKLAITALYDTTSILIPPYLLERLEQLNLIEDDLDFEFLRYKHGRQIRVSIDTAIEKVERVQQFLPVLRRVIDLVSETLMKERGGKN